MKKFVCILLACAMLVLPACKKKEQPDERWPVEIEGYTFTKPAMKAVSLSPSVTDYLYMLGYGGRLDGISEFCELPDSAKKLPRCGNALLPDIEKIKKISPDISYPGISFCRWLKRTYLRTRPASSQFCLSSRHILFSAFQTGPIFSKPETSRL